MRRDQNVNQGPSSLDHIWWNFAGYVGLCAAFLCMNAVVACGEENGGSPSLGSTSDNSPNVQDEHPLTPAIALAKNSLQKLADVRDYECLLTKREWIGGELKTQKMKLRLREEPFSVYMKFGEPQAGREVLYVDGQYGGKIVAHEGSGLAALITVNLDPTGADAMAENRYPITSVGLQNMLTLLTEQWQLESKYGEIDVKHYPQAQIGKTACIVIEASHPNPRKQFRFHLTRLYLDAETDLPIRLENYAWPRRAGDDPQLVEEYTYDQLRTNVGLTARDFDRENPNYGF